MTATEAAITENLFVVHDRLYNIVQWGCDMREKCRCEQMAKKIREGVRRSQLDHEIGTREYRERDLIIRVKHDLPELKRLLSKAEFNDQRRIIEGEIQSIKKEEVPALALIRKELKQLRKEQHDA